MTQSHTKMVEVPQQRIWKHVGAMTWAYVWEDGYDALAIVEYSWRWYFWRNVSGRQGRCSTLEEAQKAAIE